MIIAGHNKLMIIVQQNQQMIGRKNDDYHPSPLIIFFSDHLLLIQSIRSFFEILECHHFFQMMESSKSNSKAVEIKFDGSLPSSTIRMELPSNFNITDVINATDKASAEVNSVLTKYVESSTIPADKNSRHNSDAFVESDEEDSLNSETVVAKNRSEKKKPKLEEN